jgi:hypothetical protein
MAQPCIGKVAWLFLRGRRCMRYKKFFLYVALVATLQGCATAYQPYHPPLPDAMSANEIKATGTTALCQIIPSLIQPQETRFMAEYEVKSRGETCPNPDGVLTNSPPAQLPSAPQKPDASISEAKAKCADIGFTPGTEGFGKCVLQLSR